MKKQLTLILLFLVPSFCNGQNEGNMANFLKEEAQKLDLLDISSCDKEVIRIWRSNYQVLELIKSKNELATGKLINYVTKYNRRNKPIKLLKEVIELSNKTADLLFRNLTSLNIAQVKDSKKIEGYPSGVDGTTITFQTSLGGKYRLTSYWELENDRYQEINNPDIRNLRSILQVVNKEVSWWPMFKKFRDQWGTGIYHYGGVVITVH